MRLFQRWRPCTTNHDNISDTEEKHEERPAQQPTNPHTCHHKTTRERAAPSSSVQQEDSGAVTSAAAYMATCMTDSAGSKTCGEKMGGEESPDVLKVSQNGHFLRCGLPPRYLSKPRHEKRHHGKPIMHKTHCQAAKATRRAQRLATAGAREARCQL